MSIDEIVGLVEIDCQGYDMDRVLASLTNMFGRPGVSIQASMPYVTFSDKRARCQWHVHRLSRFHIANGRLWAHSQFWDIKYKIPYTKVMVVHTTKRAIG